MRICVVGMRGVPNVIGGVETHCEHVYPLMVQMDPSLDITLLTRSPHSDRRRNSYRGIETIALFAPTTAGAEAAVHTFIALIYARLFVHPDLVHIHEIGPGFFTLLSRTLGFRTVVTHHAADFERPKWGKVGRGFLKTGEYIAVRWADRVICVSEALRESVLAKYPEAAARVLTIRNGSNPTDLSSDNESSVLDELGIEPGRYVVAVGRLEATKAFHELIAAFNAAGRDDLKLVIVGSAADADPYADDLVRLRSERVVFAGYRTGRDLEKLYREAGLFMHPSHMEGYGLVVSEALLAGRPLAISDIPAHREFGLPDACYFPVGDIDAMVRILKSPDFMTFAAPGALRLQLDNTWEASARKHIALMRSLFRPRPVSPARQDDRTGASSSRKRVP